MVKSIAQSDTLAVMESVQNGICSKVGVLYFK